MMRTIEFLVIAASLRFTGSVLIRTGILSSHAQGLNGGIHGQDVDRGQSAYSSDGAFGLDNQRRYVGSQDAGKYLTDLADNKHYLNEKDFSDNVFNKQSGDSVSNLGRKQGHKVGHHKSGFKNSYHKDESGSKSSYYDDSDDQGDGYLKNVRQGSFGELGFSRNRNGLLDNRRLRNDNLRRGYYGQEGLYDKNFGVQRNYNQEQLYNDRLLQNHRNAANGQEEIGRYDEYIPNYHVYRHGGLGIHRRHSPFRTHIPVYENSEDYDYPEQFMPHPMGSYYH